MVDELTTHGLVDDPRIEMALRAVPRHVFLPGVSTEEAYQSSHAVVIDRDASGSPLSSASAPDIVALMLRQLDIRPGHRVLEIGTGTGYHAALLDRLVGPRGSVVSVESDRALATSAAARLSSIGAGGVEVIVGDGWAGAPGTGSYDRIIATVGMWEVPPAWPIQLRRDGVIVLPLSLRAGVQVSLALKVSAGLLVAHSVQPCGFIRLRGPHSGPERLVVGRGVSAWVEGAGAAEAVRTLLAEPPDMHPPLPRGGHRLLGLAVAEPGAIGLEALDRAWWGVGLLAPDGASIAAHTRDAVLTWGEPDLIGTLRDRLAAAPEVTISDLDVIVAPAPARGVGAIGVLRRPKLDVLVHRHPA
jgi:protein-L-isoaspartate(D-aspartate) O-methyltransferase